MANTAISVKDKLSKLTGNRILTRDELSLLGVDLIQLERELVDETDCVYIGYTGLTGADAYRPRFANIVPNELTNEAVLAVKKKKGKKYLTNGYKHKYILFYDVVVRENAAPEIKVTDYFRAILIDPAYYIRNLWKEGKQLAFVVDEFAVVEKTKEIKDKSKKRDHFKIYCYCVNFLSNIVGQGYFDMSKQKTKEHFEKVSKPTEL